MSTVAIFVPSRELERLPSDWTLGPMPFFLFDDGAARTRAGIAAPGQLPRARRTVLILGPSDVTLLRVVLPPLRGPRLRQALPNVIEEQLVADVSRCHIALGPRPEAGAAQTLAVIDRLWLKFLLERFFGEGCEHVKVVPAIACLPEVADEMPTATLWGQMEGLEPHSRPDSPAHIEVVLQEGASRAGGSFSIAQLAASLASFANGRALRVQELTSRTPGWRVPPGVELPALAARAATLELEALARAALSLDFDLCQFEFAATTWLGERGALRRWRWPAGLAAATVLVALAGLNIDWLVLAHEKAVLNDRATALFSEAFPKISALENPTLQMTRELDRLRARAGEPLPDDFVVMADRLARSLGPAAVASISALDYSDHALTVTFLDAVRPDAGWAQRLGAEGLTATESHGKWIVRVSA